MTSALLLLLLLLIKVQSVSCFPSCPASCVVCSEEAVICQRLAYIIAAPQTTQALLLTEGSISTVQPGALSDLINVTVISLSQNRITALDAQSFKNMPFLQTLLLDHNLLTSQTLQGGALNNLTHLEVLDLGNNRITMINSDLFKGTKSLRILKLEGNQITRLDSSSFPLNGLQVLESLDLSDNFIDYLDKNSFRGLISLKMLDISRNSLQTAPSEAFSYLTWLNNLNLDLNSWNCSCQLLELATFLSTFIQEPDKTLYNGRRMVCISADNPAVTTVLELTEANCVPSNQNITVRIDTRGSITPKLYIRDMAITGVVCFAGGVGLTLLIVLIYCKWPNKKKQRGQQNQEEVKEEGSSPIPNHNRNPRVAERRNGFRNGNDERDTNLGPRTEENGFRCPECRGEEPNPVRWERMNGRIETGEDGQRPRIRAEEDRRRPGPQQRNMEREAMNRHLVGNSTDVQGQNRQDVMHCGNCHRTFRPNHIDQNARQARLHPNSRDSSAIHGLPHQRPNNDLGRTNFYSDFDIKNLGLKRETRNVTFDLESPRETQGGVEATSPRGKDGQQDRKHKHQSSRSIKVKLNLNPLRKSKVHPKENGSPRKSKDKSGDKDGKGKKKKSKRSKDGAKEETKSKQGQETVAQVAAPVAMGHMQGLLGAQFRGGGMLMGNRTTNLLGSSGPRLPMSSLPFQGGNFPLNSMGPGNAMFQTGAPNAMMPHMNLSGPSMAPGGAPDIMRQASMGLAAGPNSFVANTIQSKQIGLNPTSLQASPVTLQATTLQANAIIPQASPTAMPTNPAILQANVSAPQALPASPSFLQANVSALQANPSIVQASTTTLPASTQQASPSTLPASASSPNLQALTTNLYESPKVVQPDSIRQPSPKTSPRAKAKPVQDPLPQSSDKPSVKTSETPASPRKDTQTPLTNASSPVVAPQSAPVKTMVENFSFSTGLTESIQGEGRIVTQADGPTVALTVDGTQAADVSILGDTSVPTESADNTASTTLLQQEYLSEEGGNSPRRKLRLVIPEKTSSRPPTALEKKIR